MTTATARSDLHLPALTSFLTLAPTTSACYPTHRRSPSASVAVSESQKTAEPSSTAEVPVGIVEEKEVITKAVTATAPVIPTKTFGEEADAELKLRRSSSLTSDGSFKTFRFLRLGPVHHGEQDGDWSEEVAVEE